MSPLGAGPELGEHPVQSLDQQCRMFGVEHQRRPDLEDVPVSARQAHQDAVLSHGLRHPPGKRGGRCAGVPVLHEFDAEEGAVAAYVADGRVAYAQCFQLSAQNRTSVRAVPRQVVAFDDLQDGLPDGRRNRVAAESVEVDGLGGELVGDLLVVTTMPIGCPSPIGLPSVTMSGVTP